MKIVTALDYYDENLSTLTMQFKPVFREFHFDIFHITSSVTIKDAVETIAIAPQDEIIGTKVAKTRGDQEFVFSGRS